MPINFKLPERPGGYALADATAGEQVSIRFRELIGPDDVVHLQERLQGLQNTLLNGIPGLPTPSRIDHILIVIRPDLECMVYINELNVSMAVRTAGPVVAGAPVLVKDILDITSVELGVEVPPDCAIVVIRSFEWKRSLFFDYGPLLAEIGPRDFDLSQVLAKQALMLLGIPAELPTNADVTETPASEHTPTRRSRLDRMRDGLAELRELLTSRVTEESRYQEVLHNHPWMFGGQYVSIVRHQKFDDANIPDFLGVRCYDKCHDIIELKQPFLLLFRKGGGWSQEFNNAWDQAERYLTFVAEQRSYLLERKQLRFEAPRCVLVVGYDLTPEQLQDLRRKEALRSVSVMTYNHILEIAERIVSLVTDADAHHLETSAETRSSG